MKKLIIVLPLILLISCILNNHPIDISNWTYIRVDSTRGKWGDYGDVPKKLRYFGLALADVDKQNGPDIISGRYWYQNPGNDMTGLWKRYEFGINVDVSLTLDIDGDEFIDILGEALPKVY